MKVTRLLCGSCGAPLGGLGTDVIFVCSNCGAGWSLEGSELTPLAVEHHASPEAGLPLPFWRVSAAAHVLKRKVRSEFVTTILRLGSRFDETEFPGKTSDSGASSERREFLLPAFYLDGLPGTGVALSAALPGLPEPPDLREDGYPDVCGCSITPEDALVLARCVAVGQEAEKSDWIAEIELVLSAARRRLVILPCTQEVEKVYVGDTGVSFFRRSVPRWNEILEYHSRRA